MKKGEIKGIWLIIGETGTIYHASYKLFDENGKEWNQIYHEDVYLQFLPLDRITK